MDSERIKEAMQTISRANHLDGDTALAEFLGVTRQTMHRWKVRPGSMRPSHQEKFNRIHREARRVVDASTQGPDRLRREIHGAVDLLHDDQLQAVAHDIKLMVALRLGLVDFEFELKAARVGGEDQAVGDVGQLTALRDIFSGGDTQSNPATSEAGGRITAVADARGSDGDAGLVMESRESKGLSERLAQKAKEWGIDPGDMSAEQLAEALGLSPEDIEVIDVESVEQLAREQMEPKKKPSRKKKKKG